MASQSARLARHNAIVIVEHRLDVSFPSYCSLLADAACAIRRELPAVAIFQQFRSGGLSGCVKGFQVRDNQAVNLSIVSEIRAMSNKYINGKRSSYLGVWMKRHFTLVISTLHPSH